MTRFRPWACTLAIKLDRSAYAHCVSPARIAARPGKHEFSVIAVGPPDSPGPALVQYAFRVQKRR